MKKCTLIMVLLIMVIMNLTGCGKQWNATEELVVILAHRENMPDFELTMLEPDLQDVVKNGGKLTIIVSDGNPEGNYNTITYGPLDTNLADKQIKGEIDGRINNVAHYMFSEKTKAKSEGANIVDALLLAGKVLDHNTSLRKHVVVIDNMLNTKSPLDMTQGGAIADISESTMDRLQKEKNVANLDNVDVDVYYMGLVKDPQERLHELDMDNLEQLWTKYFELSKANVTFHSDLPGSVNKTYEDLPYVPPVKVTKRKSVIDWNKELVIEEKNLEFNGDEDTYKYPKAAEEYLKGFVDDINDYKGSIMILGTTAKSNKYTEAEAKDLAFRRAKRTKETFLKLGVKNPEKLIVAGGGYSTVYYKNDQKKGHQVEELAKQNRSIILISDKIEKYNSLLKFAE